MVVSVPVSTFRHSNATNFCAPLFTYTIMNMSRMLRMCIKHNSTSEIVVLTYGNYVLYNNNTVHSWFRESFSFISNPINYDNDVTSAFRLEARNTKCVGILIFDYVFSNISGFDMVVCWICIQEKSQSLYRKWWKRRRVKLMSIWMTRLLQFHTIYRSKVANYFWFLLSAQRAVWLSLDLLWVS